MDPAGGLIFAMGLLALGAMIHYVKNQVASGNLGRNPAVGIRTRATMSSDAAWTAGHAAAAPLLTATYLTAYAVGVISAVLGVVLMLRDVEHLAVAVVPLAGVGAVITLLSLAANRANSAARATGPPPDNPWPPPDNP